MSEDKLTLGQYFKQEREARGIDLKQIEEQTKISAQVLKFVEDDNIEMLPPRAFLRGFLQVIANEFGLDDEELVRHMQETLAAHVKPDDEIFLPRPHSRSNRFVIWLAVAVAVIVLALGFCMQRGDSDRDQGCLDQERCFARVIDHPIYPNGCGLTC